MFDETLADYAAHKRCHVNNPLYGVWGDHWADTTKSIANSIKAQTILDYGCGKGLLKKTLPQLNIIEYDPGIPGKDEVPEPADLVVCADVLVFVGPTRIARVFDDLVRCAEKAIYIVIPFHPPERRNLRVSHYIDEPLSWWLDELTARWPSTEHELYDRNTEVPRLHYIWRKAC